MIEGLGRFRAPLGVIRLNGDTKLIVNPWAAIGTDALLLTMSTTTFILVKNPILKTISIFGGVWGLIATVLEVSKLASAAADPISREF